MRKKLRFAIAGAPALALGLALGFVLGFAACAALNFPPPGSAARDDEIIHEVHGNFQRITVVDTPDGFRRLIFDGKLDGSDAIQSEINLADPYQLTRPYPRFLMTALPAAAKLERVLIVGLGGGSMQRYLRKLLPGLTIESVEIDPEVRRIAAEYFFFKEDERQIVHLEDGAALMARVGAGYDIIFLDAFGPASIPKHLRKKEFLEAVKGRLSEGGVVCSNVETIFPARLSFS